MNHRTGLLLAAMTIATSVFCTYANGAVIFDESVSGDAPPVAPTGVLSTLASVPTTPNRDLGTISALVGLNVIVGSVQGGSVDNVDIYQFTVTVPWRADLLSYSPGANNADSAFRLHTAAATNLDNPLATAQIGVPMTNLFPAFNSAGTYRISVFESNSTTPASYQLSLTVPEPATMAGAIVAPLLACVRRRRERGEDAA